MFAGYTYSGTLTRETIQIEPTTPGAISSNHQTAAIRCNAGDYYFNSDISIIGCYFGKSDKTGPHLVAVGHHGANGGTTCDGLVFSGNVVDNPLYCGLHLADFVNVTISDNTFIAKSMNKKLGDDSAMISLYRFNSFSGNKTYKNANGQTVTNCTSYEQGGNRNYNIHGNSFLLDGFTTTRALYIPWKRL